MTSYDDALDLPLFTPDADGSLEAREKQAAIFGELAIWFSSLWVSDIGCSRSSMPHKCSADVQQLSRSLASTSGNSRESTQGLTHST